LRIVLKAVDGSHEIIHNIPNPALKRRTALSAASMTALSEGLVFFLYDKKTFERMCRDTIQTEYAEERLKSGNVLFIVDVANMALGFDFDRVRGFLCFETTQRKADRVKMHISLVCVKPRTEAESGVRVFGMATGDTLMAVATVLAEHLHCSEIFLEAIESTIGYYQRFGFQYRSSCHSDYFIVDLPDRLKRKEVESDDADMVAFRDMLRAFKIHKLRLRKCLVERGAEREHILEDDVRMKPVSSSPASKRARALEALRVSLFH
jgi:ribosomal protein S18 acetylase RimI-like enzyme